MTMEILPSLQVCRFYKITKKNDCGFLIGLEIPDSCSIARSLDNGTEYRRRKRGEIKKYTPDKISDITPLNKNKYKNHINEINKKAIADCMRPHFG